MVVTFKFFHRMGWQEKSTIDDHKFDLANYIREKVLELDIEVADADLIEYSEGKPLMLKE